MPEILEVEYYRRAAEAVVGRTIGAVQAPDAWYLKGGLTAAGLRDAVVGRRVDAARRVGKLLLVDLDDGSVVGIRFGMTGRIVVDGDAPIAELRYSTARDDASYVRFSMTFREGGELAVSDPRRLGGVELDPDESRIGPDALTLTADELRDALEGGRGPLKARLLDQARVGGLGNMLVDEILWRSSLDPARAAGELSESELIRLHHEIRSVLADLLAAGGSHMGTLERVGGERCVADGTPLIVRTIGGRTTYACPHHQR